jgi:hypothetical protein
MKKIVLDACVGLSFEAHRDAFDRYIVAAICSVRNKFSSNPCAVQRSFQGEFKAVLAQSLPAECMVNAQRIPQHVEDRWSDEIRIVIAPKIMGQMKLPDHRGDPFNLRRRKRGKGWREGINEVWI